jgi:hypothetical protein
VVLSLLDLTALTSLSRLWNTLSLLAGVGLDLTEAVVVVVVAYYRLLDTQLLLVHQLQ